MNGCHEHGDIDIFDIEAEAESRSDIKKSPASIWSRFLSKIQIDPETDCWLWTAAKDNGGYGQFYPMWPRFRMMAHRWSYEAFIGPIPNGLELDHLCGNPSCVYPHHLEPVTHQENLLRGKGGRQKTHCVNGHEFTEANIYRSPSRGIRSCRACNRAGVRRFNERRKERLK